MPLGRPKGELPRTPFSGSPTSDNSPSTHLSEYDTRRVDMDADSEPSTLEGQAPSALAQRRGPTHSLPIEHGVVVTIERDIR
jgi:hypothetical protein